MFEVGRNVKTWHDMSTSDDDVAATSNTPTD